MAKNNRTPGAFRRSFSWAFKPFVNLTGWLGYQNVKLGYINVKNTATDLLSTTIESTRKETFAEATERLNLNDSKLQRQYENFRLMLTVSFIIALLLLGLSIYWVYSGGFLGGFFVFLLTLISLSNAFRYHFWMYQIRKRQLGTSLSEWLHTTCQRKKGVTS